MKRELPSRRQWFASCGLAVLAAAMVVGLRLVVEAASEDPVAAVPPGDRLLRISSRPIAEVPRISLDPEDAEELGRLMENRPADVMKYIDGLEDRELAAKLTTEFANSVQGLHYDLLVNWMTRQKDKRIAALIFRALVPRLLREDPDSCIALSFGLGDSEEAKLARDEFFDALPLEQRVRLLNQQSVEERAWLLSRRATGFGERAPELCLEMIEALPKSDDRQEALRKLMKAWAAGGNVYHLADPMGAVKGVMAIQDSELRLEGLRLATFEWSQSNSDLASKWIANLPAGPERDASIEGLVERLAPADMDAATDWANSIADVELRLRTIERLKQEPAVKAEERQ